MPIAPSTLEGDLERLNRVFRKCAKLKRWARVDVNYDPDRGRLTWTVVQKNITEEQIF